MEENKAIPHEEIPIQNQRLLFPNISEINSSFQTCVKIGNIEEFKKLALNYHNNFSEYLMPNIEGKHIFHLAIENNHYEMALEILNHVEFHDINDIYDIPLIHYIILYFFKESEKCINFLKISKINEDIKRIDRLGRNLLHLSIILNSKDLLIFLLQFQEMLFQYDFGNFTPLHIAIELRRSECFEIIINNVKENLNLEFLNSVSFFAMKRYSVTCLQVLIKYFKDKFEFFLNSYLEKENPINSSEFYNLIHALMSDNADSQNIDLSSFFPETIFVLFNDSWRQHTPLPSNIPDKLKEIRIRPENPERLEVIDKEISHPEFFIDPNMLKVFVVEGHAEISDVLRVHNPLYFHTIKATISDISTPTQIKYDKDTDISKESFGVALNAAKTVLEAVDLIMKGECRRVFCAIRPPGHHIGVFGAVDTPQYPQMSSNGFCLFNNIAIGAAYAKYNYHETIQNIAIIDFDVHHGNGTEEIVRFLKAQQLIRKYNIPNGFLEQKSTLCNPWYSENDAKEVLFISIHGYGIAEDRLFYPGSGDDENNTKSTDPIYPGGILNVPMHSDKSSEDWKRGFREIILPRLFLFKPSLIFISSGFDAHENEIISHPFSCLSEYDYKWITEELVKIANKYSQSRIISVLEGGYNVSGGRFSTLAQSVAFHLHGLCLPSSLHYEPMNPSKQDQSYNEDVELINRKRQFYENQHKGYYFRKRKKINNEIYNSISNESYSSNEFLDSNMNNQESENNQYSQESQSEEKQNSVSQDINGKKDINNSPKEYFEISQKNSVEIKDIEQKNPLGDEEIIIVEDTEANK